MNPAIAQLFEEENPDPKELYRAMMPTSIEDLDSSDGDVIASDDLVALFDEPGESSTVVLEEEISPPETPEKRAISDSWDVDAQREKRARVDTDKENGWDFGKGTEERLSSRQFASVTASFLIISDAHELDRETHSRRAPQSITTIDT